MKVEFLDRFNFIPPEDPRTSQVFSKGYIGTVRRVCGEEAIRQGKAREVSGGHADSSDNETSGLMEAEDEGSSAGDQNGADEGNSA